MDTLELIQFVRLLRAECEKQMAVEEEAYGEGTFRTMFLSGQLDALGRVLTYFNNNDRRLCDEATRQQQRP